MNKNDDYLVMIFTIFLFSCVAVLAIILNSGYNCDCDCELESIEIEEEITPSQVVFDYINAPYIIEINSTQRIMEAEE